MKWLFILLSIIMMLPLLASAQEFNAGFVQGLWYSQEKIFVDDSVRIYVAIRNNTGSDLTGTVEFFDGDKRIERKTVQALDGRIIESWADWTPTYGSHTLSANLARIELHKVGSTTKAVEVTSALAEDLLFVDYDTDTDDIGNEDDADDDGDNISDAQEKTNGTNPLEKNIVEKEEEEKKVADTTTNSDDSETKDGDRSESSTETNEDTQEGLEQYLSESPAENVLSSITTLINTTKQNLDTYRDERKARQDAETASTSKPVVNEDGFGEITRTTEGDQNKISLPKINGDGFIDKFFSVISTLFSSIYSVILASVSLVLAHPMFVQLGILILILFVLIKFAAKFGQRPKKYR